MYIFFLSLYANCKQKKNEMKKTILFMAIIAILTSCSLGKKEYTCSISIQIPATLINQKMVLQEIQNGGFYASDTILLQKNSFTFDLKLRDTLAIRKAYIVDFSQLEPIEVALQQGFVGISIDNNYQSKVSGNHYNDLIQKNHDEDQKFSTMILALRAEYSEKESKGKLSAQEIKEYPIQLKELIDKNIDRKIAFIKENIDNPVGEYFFHKIYFLLAYEKKQEMMQFATDSIKVAYNYKR